MLSINWWNGTCVETWVLLLWISRRARFFRNAYRSDRCSRSKLVSSQLWLPCNPPPDLEDLIDFALCVMLDCVHFLSTRHEQNALFAKLFVFYLLHLLLQFIPIIKDWHPQIKPISAKFVLFVIGHYLFVHIIRISPKWKCL